MSGEKTALTPQTEAEKALSELQLKNQVGAENGIRLEFFEQEIEGVREATNERAKAAIKEEIGTKSAAILTLKPKLDQLKEVAGERFMEPDAVFEALKKVLLTVPDEEKARLLAEFEAELKSGEFEAFIAGSKALRKASEGQESPLIMKLPKQIMTPDNAGGVKVYNIDEMHQAMQSAKQNGTVRKPTWISDYVTSETRSKQWESVLRAWTSTCLEGSKDTRYRGDNGQLAYQKKVLGEGREIHSDMFLAMVLRYLQSGEELMRSDFMRLNDLDSDGDPLDVRVNDDDLYLGYSGGVARSHSGVGGSLGISS